MLGIALASGLLKSGNARVPTVSRQEMSRTTGVKSFSLPPVETSGKLLHAAEHDLATEGHQASFYKAISAETADGTPYVLYVFNLLDRTDSNIVFRADHAQTKLVDKCEWNGF